MSTIVEIAQKAGVSPRTVSRVLNTGGYVSEETRKTVQRIAEELDYRPNAIAQSFVSKKTGNIGFVLCARSLSHPFYFRILEGIEEEGKRHGYRVIFSSAEEFLAEKTKFPHILKERVVDGVLITGKIRPEFLTILKERCVPVVMVGIYDLNNNVSKVGYDACQGGYEATRYLLNLGHKRIGFLSGSLKYAAHRELLEGYKLALQEFSLNYEESLIQEDEEEQASVLIEKLTQTISFPTAIFAVNDMIAIKTMEILQEKGINVPKEVSIIGVGDIELSRHVTPRLTSIKISESEMAKKAVIKLIEEITGESSCQSNVTVPVELVVRNSCARGCPNVL